MRQLFPRSSRHPRQSHGRGVLQVGHDHGGDGQPEQKRKKKISLKLQFKVSFGHAHEAAHDLLGVIVELGVGEADAGAVERHPGAPLDAHHKGAHGEDHAQHVHVVRGQVLPGLRRRLGALLARRQQRVGVPWVCVEECTSRLILSAKEFLAYLMTLSGLLGSPALFMLATAAAGTVMSASLTSP